MRTWKKSRSGMKGFLAFSETDCEHCFDLPGYFSFNRILEKNKLFNRKRVRKGISKRELTFCTLSANFIL